MEKHNAESYFKEVDTTPPQSPKTHQVDSSDNKVVRPHEPGIQTKEYATVSDQSLDPELVALLKGSADAYIYIRLAKNSPMTSLPRMKRSN